MLELSHFNTSYKQNLNSLGHGWSLEVSLLNHFFLRYKHMINHEWELDFWWGDLSSLPDVSRLRAECSWQLSCRITSLLSQHSLLVPSHSTGELTSETSCEICKKWEAERRNSGQKWQDMPETVFCKGKKKAGGVTLMYLDGVRTVLKESFGNYAHCQHFMSCTNNSSH